MLSSVSKIIAAVVVATAVIAGATDAARSPKLSAAVHQHSPPAQRRSPSRSNGLQQPTSTQTFKEQSA